MAKLLMVTGLGSVNNLVSDKKGAFYYTLEAFHKYWDRIDIISPKIKGQKSGVKVLFDNVYIHISPRSLLFHPFWFIKKGVEIYRREKFDLMTIQEYPPFYNGIGARLLWDKIKVPYILEIHHIPGYPKAGSLKEKIYSILTRIYIKQDASKAKAVRVVNRGQVPDFLIKAGVPEDKIIYISSMYIDLNIFKPAEVQKEFDLIFVGRLEKNKGINLFIDAVKKSGLRGLVVGSGPLAKDVKSEKGITYHGWVKDSRAVADLINRSKLLVMPSYNEGGPRVVLEAMASGVPVIATRVGIVPNVVVDGITGETVDWSSDDISQKAKGLLADPDKYRAYSYACVKIAQKFERENAIRNYAQKLQQFI